MNLFKKILVVFDDEKQTGPIFERAIRLSQKNQATLKVVTVIEEAAGRITGRFRSPLSSEMLNQIMEEHARQLEAFVQPARERGVALDVKVLQGTPFLEIIREVMRYGHDLVMKSVTPMTGWREILFSSTDMHLMRKCPSAVWIMKPGLAAHHNRILAAVDPQPDNEAENELNLRVMDLATSLARTEQSELNVIHAWTLYGESMLRGPRFNLSASEVDTLAVRARDEHKARLDNLLQRYDLQPLNHHIYLLKGAASQVIPEFAREHRTEIIVMGTASHSGIAGLIMGNTAENIVRQVDCSVLTVKPKGFVTPVTLDE